MDTEKWDKRYLRIAKEVANWSKEKKKTRKVGAVIVKDNRIISTGFNGFPTGVLDTDERLNTKDIKQDLVVHAEINALIVAGSAAKGATLYVYGKPICARCAASIIQAGIVRVVGPRPKTQVEVKAAESALEDEQNETGKIDWEKSGRTARQMFEETTIQYHSYDRDKKRRTDASVDVNVKTLKAITKHASR